MTEKKVSRKDQLTAWIDGHPVLAAVCVLLIVSGVFWLATMILFPNLFPEWVGVAEVTKTGFEQSQKTLWDWLDLFVVSLVVALALFWLNTSQKNRETQRQKDDRRQAALQNYFDKMSELILDKKLGDYRKVSEWLLEKGPGDFENNKGSERAAVVARTLTLSAFRNLDPDRNASVLRFLGDAGLADKILRGTDTQGVDFIKSDLRLANLENAYLRGAILNEAYLNLAELSGANLCFAKLRRVSLISADLRGANLYGADLSGAWLSGAKYNKQTVWPTDYDQKEAGAILVDDKGNPIEDSDEGE